MGFYNPSAQGVATSIVIGSTVITGGSGSGYALVDGGGVINEFPYGGATNAGAGTTTTLTASSFRQQTITGTLGQTFKLPDATTLIVGDAFYFNNNGSSGTLTVQNAGAGAITTVPISGYCKVTVISNGSANGTWDNHAWAPSNATWGSAALNISGSFVIQTNSATALTLDTSQNATFAGQVKTSVTAPLLSTDTTAGAGAGPTWEMYRNITGAANNVLGEVLWTGNSSTGVKRTAGYISQEWRAATNGAESTTTRFYAMNAGTLTEQAEVVLGDWKFAQSVYLNNSAGSNPAINFTSSTSVIAPSDGLLKITNNAGTGGFALDGTVADTVKFANRAGNAAATMQFGTFAASAGETFAGTITIKDYAGNSRKVAIFA